MTTPFSTVATSHSRDRTRLPVAGMISSFGPVIDGVRPNGVSLVDHGVAGLVLVPVLIRGVRKRRAELAQVGGDLVAPGDRALVGRLSDRVLSVNGFAGLRIALEYQSVIRSMTSRASPTSASSRRPRRSYAGRPGNDERDDGEWAVRSSSGPGRRLP